MMTTGLPECEDVRRMARRITTTFVVASGVRMVASQLINAVAKHDFSSVACSFRVDGAGTCARAAAQAIEVMLTSANLMTDHDERATVSTAIIALTVMIDGLVMIQERREG